MVVVFWVWVFFLVLCFCFFNNLFLLYDFHETILYISAKVCSCAEPSVALLNRKCMLCEGEKSHMKRLV